MKELTHQQKIEAIQERMEAMYDNKTYYYNDIQYLLQRLERYETALKEITEIDLTWDEPLPTAMRRLAKEALKDEIT